MEQQSTPEQRCEHCGASLKKYWHKLTPGLVSALVKIHRAVNYKKINDIKIDAMTGDLALTHVERCNWQKLRLHGLVARVKFMGNVQRGHWLITRKGFQFLSGKEIPARVLSFRNRVEGHSPEEVDITRVVRSIPYFESIADIQFEYAEPTEEGELELDNTPIVYARKKKLKKGQQPCPQCGEALVRRIDTSPGKDASSLAVKEYFLCSSCKYDSRI